MRFEIETDTLRATCHRDLGGVWRWEISRLGDEDDLVRRIFNHGERTGRLHEVIDHVLHALKDVASYQAGRLELEVSK